MLLQPESIPFTDETAFLCAFLAVFKAFFTILPTTFFSIVNPLPAYPSGTQPVPFFSQKFRLYASGFTFPDFYCKEIVPLKIKKSRKSIKYYQSVKICMSKRNVW